MPTLVPAVMVQHRTELYRALDAIGGWINDYLATNPSLADREAVRTRIAALIRAWSATSPVFNRLINSAGGIPRDHELSELVLDNRQAGADFPSMFFNDYYLHSIAAQATRNRFAMLTERLLQAVLGRVRTDTNQVQLLNLKSQAGRELIRLADQPAFSLVQITCLDDSATALRALRAELDNLLPGQAHYLRVDPRQFARGPLRPSRPYDIIYAASFFTYLTKSEAIALVRDCYGLLAPGGILILAGPTNGIPANERILGTWLLGLQLYYRDEADWRDIFAQTPFGVKTLQFEREPLGGDMLVSARRP